MPIDWLVLGSAALTGLLGGAHCVLMCGGIAAGFGAMSGRSRLADALTANGGRVLGYVLAGAIAGGLGGGILQVARLPWLATASRALVGAVLVLAALRLLDVGGRLKFLSAPGQRLWSAMRPLQKHFIPADTAVKRLVLGLLWGWLPCGLSTTLLGAAWLQASAVKGAMTMAAFGLATLPLMVPLTWSGARATGWLQQRGLRRLMACVILLAGVVTLAAPWLARHPAAHNALKALGCSALPI